MAKIFSYRNRTGRIGYLSLLLLTALFFISICEEEHITPFTVVQNRLNGQNVDAKTNGTEGFYISPHALGKQNEVHLTLQKIQSQVKVAPKTTYNHSDITYTIENMTVSMDYNDDKQKIDISARDQVTVTGGRILFDYTFNYTKKNSTSTTTGYGKGSVYSDSLTYGKQMIANGGYIEWALIRGSKGYTNLQIKDRFTIKKLEPFNQSDITNLIEMMDRAFTSISPSNIQSQILSSFNTNFPPSLNDSLNHQVFGQQVNYSYHNGEKQYNMTITHTLYGFDIEPTDGYTIFYLTEVKGRQNLTTCQITVPPQHYSFQLFGGIQNIHLNCLYKDILIYMQEMGWLDTSLNSNWQTNSFQFYAGDLYDLINNLYLKVPARSILEGKCKANKNNLNIKYARDEAQNTYQVDIQYNCTLTATSRTTQAVDVLIVLAQTRFFIKVYADKLALNFEVASAEALSLAFIPVNSYFVTNMNLALFKFNQVMKKMKAQKVFGTGYPSLARQSPRTRVEDKWVLYYDSSAHAHTNIDLNEM